MTQKYKIVLCSFFLLILLLGSAQPILVKAALSITSITPNLVQNDSANTITIAGTDFAPDAQVKLGGSDVSSSTGMITNRISDNELLANIPRDFPPGVYTVYVVNPGEVISVPAGLTVISPPTAPTSTPGAFVRPQISLVSYSTNVNGIKFGQNFTLTVRLKNNGGASATGIQVSFSSSELLMLKNGGVVSVGDLPKGDKTELTQVMTAAFPFYGVSLTTLEMNVSYYDGMGTPFTEKFTLNLGVYNTVTDLTAATPTPTGMNYSQLIISKYETDLKPLEPGSQFSLSLSIINMGNLTAKSVTMIVGGGSDSSTGSGTPGAGGVSGSGGDFSNFAPVDSSNLQSLGDILPQSSLTATHQMIVNVNTNPGAYPMKVSFSYQDPSGNQINDEQVITLLVFSLPKIEIGFYQPVMDLFSFQPNVLPIQVVNTGRKYTVLGNLTVSSGNGLIENGQIFIGGLDTGGYFTYDVTFSPETTGQVEILVSIDYTDDFNLTRTISKSIPLTVIEMQTDPFLDPSNPDFNEGIPVQEPESFWHKVWRFILGIFGLDSAAPVETQPIQIDPAIPAPAPGYKPGKG
jgi:hypothetical protein